MAQMNEVSEDDLSQVFAQAGVSYNWVNSKLSLSADSISFSDTDGSKDWLEFNNFSVTGPIDGQYFTHDYSQTALILTAAHTLDVAREHGGQRQQTFYQMVTNDHKSPDYTIDNGLQRPGLAAAVHTRTSNPLIRWQPDRGRAGPEFEYLSNRRIDISATRTTPRGAASG
jgi:hypothetical protein